MRNSSKVSFLPRKSSMKLQEVTLRKLILRSFSIRGSTRVLRLQNLRFKTLAIVNCDCEPMSFIVLSLFWWHTLISFLRGTSLRFELLSLEFARFLGTGKKIILGFSVVLESKYHPFRRDCLHSLVFARKESSFFQCSPWEQVPPIHLQSLISKNLVRIRIT